MKLKDNLAADLRDGNHFLDPRESLDNWFLPAARKDTLCDQ